MRELFGNKQIAECIKPRLIANDGLPDALCSVRARGCLEPAQTAAKKEFRRAVFP
jgi:hypothetical protein